VLTVKPGFVNTPMTYGSLILNLLLLLRRKKLPRYQSGDPQRKDILYTPWFWQLVMGLFVYYLNGCLKG